MGWSRNMLYPEQDTGPLGCLHVTGLGGTHGVHPSGTGATSDRHLADTWHHSAPSCTAARPHGPRAMAAVFGLTPPQWQQEGPASTGTQACLAQLSGLRRSFPTFKNHAALSLS